MTNNQVPCLPRSIRTALQQRLHSVMFRAVHGNHLVYNTCLEDPALDRVALQLRPDDRLLVITSAGCNALDYLLTGPAEVNAVDINPRQSALLELKVAGIRALDHASFFALFGRGFAPDARHVYRESLRPLLSEPAPRLLGQAHLLLPGSRLAQVVLLPRHRRPRLQGRPHLPPPCASPGREHRRTAPGPNDRRAARDLRRPDARPPLEALAALVLVPSRHPEPLRRPLDRNSTRLPLSTRAAWPA